MTNLKVILAGCAALAMSVSTLSANAQDDLDDLLKDLDAESSKPSAKKAPEASSSATEASEPKAKKADVADATVDTASSSAKPSEEKPTAKEESSATEASEPQAEQSATEASEPKAKKADVADATPADASSSKAISDSAAEEGSAKPASNEKVDEVLSLIDQVAAETPAEKKEATKASEPQAKKADVADAKAKKPARKAKRKGPDAELLDNIATTERLRRDSLDEQAKREVVAARECMGDKEFTDAIRHYGLAAKLLNDSPSSKALRRECDQGIAEGLYRAALQEEDLGRHAKAVELMEKALELRHPKARRTLEKWAAQPEVAEQETKSSDVAQVQNEADYKAQRETIRRRLRRSRQYLALRDMKRALDECESVLKVDPYNQEAIRLRNAIQKKRQTILEQERKTTRDGMIADVDEAWRPVYAVNATQLTDAASETVKTQTGEDPERTQEQDIEKRMKEMRLPTIEFKPPATIIEAVEFFRTASRDYDRPDIPIEKRGFNFVLRTPVGAIKQQAAAANNEAADDFASNGAEEDENATANGLPPIPKITASDISFYDALKLVCDSVDYKFIVRGPVVMVMQKDMSTAELLSRKYNVPEAFVERVNSASEEMKELGGGFGSSKKKAAEEEEAGEGRDWKAFFEEMGVKWPEGSSIKHIKALGKLYVRNTRENLAEFEKVLDELGGQPQLIEIETRFVEVSQEDLNSLGFEWILNSDYSLNIGNQLGKALGVKNGVWGTLTDNSTWSSSDSFSKSVNGRTQANDGVTDAFTLSRNNSSTTTSQSTTDAAGRSVAPRDGSSDFALQTVDKNNSGWTDISSTVIKNPSSYSNSRTYNRTEANYGSQGGKWIPAQQAGRNIGINSFGGTSDYQNGNRYLSTKSNHISGESNSTNDQFFRINAFLGQADLSMILHMLSQRSDTDLLSAPKVVTKSGEQAIIKVVTEYIYPTDYDVQLQSSSSGSSGSSSSGGQSAILAVVEPQNFTMREVGVILDVIPTYSEANGGTIDLELKPAVVDEPVWHNYGMKLPFSGNTASGTMADIGSIFTGMSTALSTIGATLTADEMAELSKTVVASATSAAASVSSSSSATMTWYEAPMEQPWFHVRSIDSKVSITPGSTVVMGGLITESRKAMDDKIPFLGDLPFIGRFFRSHAEQTTKRNLLIFVTGRLITPSGRELSLNNGLGDSAEVKSAPKAE